MNPARSDVSTFVQSLRRIGAETQEFGTADPLFGAIGAAMPQRAKATLNLLRDDFDDDERWDSFESLLYESVSHKFAIRRDMRTISGADSPRVIRSIRRSAAKPGKPNLSTIAQGVRRASKVPAERVEAWLDAKLVNPAESLRVGQPTKLSIGLSGEVIAEVADAFLFLDFPEGVDRLTLSVTLIGDDFAVDETTLPLTVDRSGESIDTAVFTITPKRRGVRKVTAIIFCDNSYLQTITITLRVSTVPGPALATVTVGRGLGSAPVPRKPVKRVVLYIQVNDRGGAYEAALFHETGVKPNIVLGVDRFSLPGILDEFRLTLGDIVDDPIVQQNIDIPDKKRDEILRKLAEAGNGLFQQIFRSGEARVLGAKLMELVLASDGELVFQVTSKEFVFPWSLMYVADQLDSQDSIELRRFVGMSCVVEQLPVKDPPSDYSSTIDSGAGKLSLSFNLNTRITELGSHFIESQQIFWGEFPDYAPPISVTDRTERKQLVAALKDPATTDQILYLYCHAESNDDYPTRSFLELSDTTVSVGELRSRAPVSTQLSGHPLVVINACESGQLSPRFYEGFVPYFIEKGARGVIGTECKVPALFAAEWGNEFFRQVFTGEELGWIMLRLRRSFMARGNPLGLTYGCYCAATTRITPAVSKIAVSTK